MRTTTQPPPIAAGVGLRLPHIQTVAASRPDVAWFEVHPENFVANPHAAELLQDLSRNYDITLHSVGISVGSASGVNSRHLRRVRALADAVHPVRVSGHLAWSTHGEEFLNDLLPVPYTAEALARAADGVNRVQDVLGRAYLVENPASYLGFKHSSMSEAEFLTRLVERTGCGLLCDVSNVCVTVNNLGGNAFAYIDALPAAAVAQIHLGGYTAEADDATPGAQLLIDSHAEPVAEASWELYRYVLRRFGPQPTLIEWDNAIPDFNTLLTEARRAERIAASELAESEVAYAHAS